ncbi:hypothetical protein RD792_014087, partial [Penstemon davidsonii]
VWETFLVVLVVYTAWASPFEFGFLDKPKGPLSIVDNVVNLFFAIDIVLTFFVAYLDRTTYLLTDKQKQIALNYATSCLALDVISTIPSELVHIISPESYGLFNMLRLWRLKRLGALFSRLEKGRNFDHFWLTCAKLICVTLFSVHCAGCFYYLLAAHYRAKTRDRAPISDFLQLSLWTRYITSMYWSITTLTTVGYGDYLRAENTSEMIFDIWYMLFNLVLASYLIGNVTKMMIHETSNTLQFRDRYDQLPSLKFLIEGSSTISPSLLYSLVDEVYLFRGVSSDLLFQLVSEMKAEYFRPKGDVILQNEAPTDFYILLDGAVVVGEAKTGDICGEIGVLCFRPQPFTVRKKRISLLLRLDRATFLNIVRANFRDGTIIMNNLLQHMKDIKDQYPVMEEILLETAKDIAESSTSISSVDNVTGTAKVTVSCPGKGDFVGKIVFLPHSFEELLEISRKMYGVIDGKFIMSKDGGAVIDDIEVIRNGDHLVFVSDIETDVQKYN